MRAMLRKEAEDASLIPYALRYVNQLLRVMAAKARPCSKIHSEVVITHGIVKAVS